MEIFVNNLEALEEVKAKYTLEDKGMSSRYFGYQWFIGTNEEGEEADVYFKERKYDAELTMDMYELEDFILSFMNMSREDLIEWLKKEGEGSYWNDHFADYSKDKLLKLVVRMQVRDLQYANSEANFDDDMEDIERIMKLEDEVKAKDQEIKRLKSELDELKGRKSFGFAKLAKKVLKR